MNAGAEVRGPDLPTLDEVRANYIRENGGRRNIESLKSLIMSGLVISEEEGISREFKLYRKRPNKVRFKMNFGDQYVEKLYDGEKVYQRSGMAGRRGDYVELDEDEAKLMRQDSHIESLFYVLSGEPGALRLVGEEKIAGVECYRFDVTDEDTYTLRSIWLSKEDYREVKYLSHIMNDEGEEVSQTIHFFDYEKFHGIWFAQTMEYREEGHLIKIVKIQDLRGNVGIFDGFFQAN